MMHRQDLKSDLLLHYSLEEMPFVHCSGVCHLLGKQFLYLSLDRVPLTKSHIHTIIMDKAFSCLKVIFIKNEAIILENGHIAQLSFKK